VTDYLEIWCESCATGVHPRLVCFNALQPVVKALMMQEVFRNKNILTGAGFSPVIIYTKNQYADSFSKLRFIARL
jgi:hypothetical protein